MLLANLLARIIELALISLVFGMLASWTWTISRLFLRPVPWPEIEPRIGRWHFTTVVRVIALYFATRLMVEIGYFQIFAAPPGGKISPTVLIGLVTVNNAACLVMIPFGLLARDRVRLSSLIWNSGSLRLRVGQGVMTALLAAPVAYFCQFLAIMIWKPTEHPLSGMLKDSFGFVAGSLAFISAVLLAPAVEELLFRGILLHWLTPSVPEEMGIVVEEDVQVAEARDIVHPYESPKSMVASAILKPRGLLSWESLVPNMAVSVVFAGMHAAQWPAPVPLFILSMTFGWLFQRTGSLGAVVVAHATFNSISTLGMIYSMLRGLEIIPN